MSDGVGDLFGGLLHSHPLRDGEGILVWFVVFPFYVNQDLALSSGPKLHNRFQLFVMMVDRSFTVLMLLMGDCCGIPFEYGRPLRVSELGRGEREDEPGQRKGGL